MQVNHFLKHYVLIISCISSFFHVCKAQTVISSCDAPDSIVEFYKHDAATLALRHLYADTSVVQSDLIIPDTVRLPILNALIAVYNASSIPERDTVVDFFSIHTNVYPATNSFVIRADSNLVWMNNLQHGIYPIGNSFLDSLLSVYQFELTSYFDYPYMLHPSTHSAVFSTANDYNIKAVVNRVQTIAGVYFADPNTGWNPNVEILDALFPTYTELTFRYGWGDCLAGCMYKRYWKFRIFPDCSVSFMGSYGQSYPLAFVTENKLEQTIVYPNPFSDELTVSGIIGSYDLIIYDAFGQSVRNTPLTENTTVDVSDLSKGVYVVNIQNATENKVFKVVKH